MHNPSSPIIHSLLARSRWQVCTRGFRLRPASAQMAAYRYHRDAITFIGKCVYRSELSQSSHNPTPPRIATKCDEISCKEVIKSLKLLRDPLLIQIESDLEASKHDLSFHQDRKLTLEGLKTGMTQTTLNLDCFSHRVLIGHARP